MEDFPQLEHVLHRLYGATRYVGVPHLQVTSAAFEQFVSGLRKERRTGDASIIEKPLQHFDEVQSAIQQVELAAAHILKQHNF